MKKKIIQKNKQILDLGSIIFWDKEFQKIDPNGSKRIMVNISCGKCGKVRPWRKDMVLRKLKTNTFTGICKNCYQHLIWKDKHRNRPFKRKSTEHGYIKIFLGLHHPMADKRGEIYEHRLIMSEILNRPLQKWEHIHHKDGNRSNNNPENLELHPNSEHQTIRFMKERITYLENILNKYKISF